MEASTDAPLSSGNEPSLTGIRIAAAIGFLVGVALVALAFTQSWWMGVGALFVVPAIPMGFVLTIEAVRGD